MYLLGLGYNIGATTGTEMLNVVEDLGCRDVGGYPLAGEDAKHHAAVSIST